MFIIGKHNKWLTKQNQRGGTLLLSYSCFIDDKPEMVPSWRAVGPHGEVIWPACMELLCTVNLAHVRCRLVFNGHSCGGGEEGLIWDFRPIRGRFFIYFFPLLECLLSSPNGVFVCVCMFACGLPSFEAWTTAVFFVNCCWDPDSRLSLLSIFCELVVQKDFWEKKKIHVCI